MSVGRALQWQKARTEAEALLTRIDADAVVARQQRARIVRAKAERILKISDEELRERFRRASADATEWPGLRSEFDKESGRVEFLASPLKLQAQEGTTPAARGQKTTIPHPERLYATQYWLHRHGEGHGAMLPEHEAKFGKAPVIARTLDGRLHLLDGHHTVFFICAKASGRCRLSCSIFQPPFFKTAMAGPGADD